MNLIKITYKNRCDGQFASENEIFVPESATDEIVLGLVRESNTVSTREVPNFFESVDELKANNWGPYKK